MRNLRVPKVSGGFEMFCPKCATQNVEGASFCRSCGANVSLIPDALAGNLAQSQTPAERDDPYDWSSRRRRRGKSSEPSLEKGIVNVFVGLGFIIAALAVMARFPGGVFWGWSFFIPGFSNLGRGVAAMVAAQRKSSATAQVTAGNQDAFSARRNSSPPTVESRFQTTGRLMAPVPSVTEGTTRHLGAEAPTRHFDPLSGEEKLP